MSVDVLCRTSASRRMRVYAVSAFREAGSVRCAIVVDPFRVARTYVVAAGAGCSRLAAGKALAAVLAHLIGRKAVLARFTKMRSPARGARANVCMRALLLLAHLIAAAGTAAADVTQNLYTAAVFLAVMASPFASFNTYAVVAAQKICVA